MTNKARSKKERMTKGVEILIAEDSPTQAEALKHFLEENGHKVTVTPDGKEALEAARKQKPTLIISDIVMPVMDGYQLCSEVKNDIALQDVPVILLTSLSDPKDVIKGLQSRADAFIVKPYDEGNLISHIQDVLTTREVGQRPAEEKALEIVFGGETVLIPSDSRQILGLLLSTYQGAVQKNRELIKTQDELRTLNERLEQKVDQRTAALKTEITEHKRAKEDLIDSQTQLSAVQNTVGEGIIAIDSEGKIVMLNEEVQNIWGYQQKELMGETLEILMPKNYRERQAAGLKRYVKTGVAHVLGRRLEFEGLKKDGSRFPLVINIRETRIGESLFFTAAVSDISERKALEEQFLQAQRMEVVGKLAGGIAHDFNNLLTGISGYTTLLLEEIEHDSAVGQDLLQIHALADRAAGLTRQLLSFSRKQPMESVILDLNTTVKNTSKMLERIIGEDVNLKFVPAPDLSNVSANPGQLEQALLNLAVNARDAMPDGGTLTIETLNVNLDRVYAEGHFEVEFGSYVMLSVSDNGCGMDKETKKQVFEPFFTTKGREMGTGLGLSTVYGIVKQHEGHIWVYSEPGKGTTFKIYLPRVEAGVLETTETAEQEFAAEGSETILVVEDERALRDLIERVLQGLGYKVFITSGAETAEKVFERYSDTIDLLLTDVIMPGPSGPELYRSLAAKRPSLKVLYMSGYTDISILRNAILDQEAFYLQKPFTPKDLARKVRGVLDHEEMENE